MESRGSRTSHTREQLSRKVLNLRAWERYKAISLQKVEYTLSKQIGDNADMVSKVK